MHLLVLARVIQAEREREMAEAHRWRRWLDRGDAAQRRVTDTSVAAGATATVGSAVRSCAPSTRASAGSTRP